MLDNVEEDINSKIKEKETKLQELNTQKEKVTLIEIFAQKLLDAAREKGKQELENTILTIINTLSNVRRGIESKILLI